MPTLPLHNAAAPPDGYHRVTAPGGYEWWQFRVTPRDDVAAPRLIALTFYDGRTHDPDYRRRYRAFSRRPTRHVPPVPAEYRGTELTIAMEGARPQITYLACAADDFPVADDGKQLRCGDVGGFVIELDGSVRAWSRNDGTFVELLLRPRDGSRGEPVATPVSDGVVGQHWQAVAPTRYDATGEFNTIRFEGTGAIEHRWGTAPLPLSATSRQ